MIIKSLKKEEVEEGFTLDFVNTIGFEKKRSPAIFRKGDEAVSLIECSTGFWVMYEEGKYLKDKSGLMVFKERDAQMARARYLFYHAEEEKSAIAIKVLENLKIECDKVLKDLKSKLDYIKSLNGDSFSLRGALESQIVKERGIETEYEKYKNNAIEKLPEMEDTYTKLWCWFIDNNLYPLAEALGIIENDGPLLISVQKDDPIGMRVLKNVFGAKQLEAMDFDMNKIRARLKVEKSVNY